MILSILSKLGPDYAVFISTFHAMKRALGKGFTVPSLGEFTADLTKKQDKLIQMGSIKYSKSQALTTK